ncbi:MAG: hypothetical protein ACP5KC_09595 [Infirmifilum sp.]
MEFELEELAARISGKISGTVELTHEALELALYSLEKKGYLKILRVPPSSKAVKERLLSEVGKLNVAFITGQLDPSSYVAKLEEIASKCPSLGVKPLPPAGLSDVVKGIAHLLESLRKLSEERSEESAKEELKREYVAKLEGLVEEAERLLDVVQGVVEQVSRQRQELARRIEVIRLDERVRGVDRSAEVTALQERLQKVDADLAAIRRWALGGGGAPDIGQLRERFAALEKKLSGLEAEREILEARALIEGREDLKVKLASLTREIAQTREEVERGRREIEHAQAGERLLDVVIDVTRALYKGGSLPSNVYNAILHLVNRLRSL